MPDNYSQPMVGRLYDPATCTYDEGYYCIPCDQAGKLYTSPYHEMVIQHTERNHPFITELSVSEQQVKEALTLLVDIMAASGPWESRSRIDPNQWDGRWAAVLT